MKTRKTNLKTGALVAGAIVTGTATSFAMTNSSEDLLSYTSLGSGAEIRTELIQLNELASGIKTINSATTFKFAELNCGEGKCGEGKCGEGEADKKKEGDTKTSEDKTDESKCGEGKCGEGKCGGESDSEDK